MCRIEEGVFVIHTRMAGGGGKTETTSSYGVQSELRALQNWPHLLILHGFVCGVSTLMTRVKSL